MLKIKNMKTHKLFIIQCDFHNAIQKQFFTKLFQKKKS